MKNVSRELTEILQQGEIVPVRGTRSDQPGGVPVLHEVYSGRWEIAYTLRLCAEGRGHTTILAPLLQEIAKRNGSLMLSDGSKMVFVIGRHTGKHGSTLVAWEHILGGPIAPPWALPHEAAELFSTPITWDDVPFETD